MVPQNVHMNPSSCSSQKPQKVQMDLVLNLSLYTVIFAHEGYSGTYCLKLIPNLCKYPTPRGNRTRTLQFQPHLAFTWKQTAVIYRLLLIVSSSSGISFIIQVFCNWFHKLETTLWQLSAISLPSAYESHFHSRIVLAYFLLYIIIDFT